MTKTEQLQQMIDESSRIMFFGGVEVSIESGIPDFRSIDGLYHQSFRYLPEEMLSHSFYVRHTAEFFDSYRKKMLCLDTQPNAVHRKLAELEQAEEPSAVVTQNIDGLHQKAGSRRVYELHGFIHRNYCQKCHKEYDAEFILHSEGIPTCTCGGTIKPDVVLYEEGLDQDVINDAVTAIRKADMLTVGETSLAVYPAAGLIHYSGGSRLVVIDRSSTPVDQSAALMISDPIGGIFSQVKITKI